MKYITKQQLQNLSTMQLDVYAEILANYHEQIVTLMEEWLAAYNETNDEYKRREPPDTRTFVDNDSGTKH